jgi:hypothetical protein
MSIKITIGEFSTMTDSDLAATVESALAAYRPLDTKGKATARKNVEFAMKACIDGMDLAGASFAMNLGKALVSSGTKVADEIDPREVLINAVAELEIAAEYIRSGMHIPAGLDVSEIEWDSIEWADVSDHKAPVWENDTIRAGAKAFAEAKRSRTADRADIGEAILSAFEGLDSGAFLTVSEIANKSGSGTGAIAARLFPTRTDKATGEKVDAKCTVEGIRPGVGGAKNVKGAYLV